MDEHALAWAAALREAGHDVPVERIRPLIGKGGDKILPEVAGIDPGSDKGKRVAARRTALFLAEGLPRVTPTKGARPLLEALRGAGVPLGVATSAKPRELRELLAIVGAEWLLESASDAGDARESKPDPDVVLAALRRLRCPASETVLVGDTRWDVEAAERSGVRSIGLRASGSSDEDLAGAVAVYDDPAALLADLDRSPLAAAVARAS